MRAVESLLTLQWENLMGASELGSAVKIGVIGGSGLYQMEALTDVQEVKVETPFGDPSDALIVGKLDHGRVLRFRGESVWIV